jgi:hypothetical protein
VNLWQDGHLEGDQNASEETRPSEDSPKSIDSVVEAEAPNDVAAKSTMTGNDDQVPDRENSSGGSGPGESDDQQAMVRVFLALVQLFAVLLM